MSNRPRIDLDGVTLLDPARPTSAIVILRHRTTEGLVLLMPESAEFNVAWSDIDHAHLDLGSGEVEIAFSPDYVAGHNWLRGAKVLRGRWTDRYVMG